MMSDSLQIAREVVRAQDRQLEGKGLIAYQGRYDALVLDARLRQSLATVRSLGSRGLRVAALGNSPGLPAFSSRWCQQSFVCPAPEGTEACFFYLEQVLDSDSVGVLIASSDATIALLRRHRVQLEQRVRLALAKEPALTIAVNKERTAEVAKGLGVRVPRAVKVSNVSEVKAALREIGLPAMIKPTESWMWDGQQGIGISVTVKPVTTLADAWQAVEELTRFGGITLFQEYIAGEKESVSLLYAGGQIYARYAQLHTRSVGGQSSLRYSIAVPSDIGEQAERLVREIDLEGCAEVEFRRDCDGNAYLMEINPRLWASTEHAAHSGIDFPYLLYQWANGESLSEVKSYRVGTRLRSLAGHYQATVLAVKRCGGLGAMSPLRAVLDFCLYFFIPAKYDYVDWRDPLPICLATADFAGNVLDAIGKRLLKTMHGLVRRLVTDK